MSGDSLSPRLIIAPGSYGGSVFGVYPIFSSKGICEIISYRGISEKIPSKGLVEIISCRGLDEIRIVEWFIRNYFV